MVAKTYKSEWGWFPWAVVAFTIASCLLPTLTDGIDLLMIVLVIVVVTFELITFVSIYYKVVGDELWVYTFFRPSKLPIKKIAEITPTKSVLSSPAVSISKRIAITFTDRSVLKSSMPLIISPKNQREFVEHLQSVNPNIIIKI